MTAAIQRTEPRARPILFSAPMVRAILAGTKTQTRRVVAGPVNDPRHRDYYAFRGFKTDLGDPASLGFLWAGFGRADDPCYWKCPYGAPGDRLWVRETFMPRAGGLAISQIMQPRYRADEGEDRPEWRRLWKPSIHMPRWASRIDLEVTEVRVQRLQDISEEDAAAEGIDLTTPPGATVTDMVPSARRAFRELWDSINSERGFGWDANPWVWCVSFRRVRP